MTDLSGEQSRARFEALGRAAGVTAHDINNELTVIYGQTRVLLDRMTPDDPARATLAEILLAGERAAALIRDFLATGRMSRPQPVNTNLHSVLRRLLPSLRSVLGDRIDFVADLRASDPRVAFPPNRLEQIVLNLAVNARDAMPYGGRFLLGTADISGSPPERPAGVLLTVADTGQGMDEVTRERVFDPFFTTKEAGKGAGLGLSIVHDIVTQQGGFVSLESEPGKGTTFQITLPALSKGPATSRAVVRTETVLLVESSDDARAAATMALEAEGYRVLAAGSPEGAVELAASESASIDLLVIPQDLSAPEVFDLVGSIREVHPRVRALFLADPMPPGDGILPRRVRDALDEPTPRGRIVVADDEQPVRSFVRAVLESAGFCVVETSDGAEALRQVERGGVDLVITDLVMPGKEGLETIQDLHRCHPRVPVVAISGAVNPDYLRIARALGAAVTLHKPIRPELLLAAVFGLLPAGRKR